jgi:uncharacterized protein (DUF1778 family)
MTYDNPNNRKDKVLRFRLTEEDRDRIEAAARARRTYLTDYIRSAVMSRLERDEERIRELRAERAQLSKSKPRRSVV